MAKKISVALELDTSNYNRGLGEAQNKTKDFTSQSTSAVNGLKSAFMGMFAAIGVGKIVGLADEMTTLKNRIRAVSDSNAEVAAAMKLVQQVANGTRNDIGAVASLYSDITLATEEMALSQKDIAGLTKTFSQTLKISGADANTAAGAIRQFGQALASGKLSGDEFVSVNEANSRMMGELADSLGVARGELKDMASDGLLTADILVAALQEMATSVDEDFAKTIPTAAESLTVMKNNAIMLFDAIEENTGIFEGLANAIRFAADNVETIAKIMGVAFAAAVTGKVVALAAGMWKFVMAMRAAAVAGTMLQGVTGLGIAKVGAGILFATTQIKGMNKMFEEQAPLIDEVNEATANLVDTDTEVEEKRQENHTKQTARQLYEQRLIDMEAEKKAKAAEKDAARAEKEEARAAKKAERDAARAEKEEERATKKAEADAARAQAQEEREAKAEERRLERHAKEMGRAQEVLAQAEAKMQADLEDIEATVQKIGLSETQIKQLEVTNGLNREREQKLAEIAKYNISDEEKNKLQQELNELYDEQIVKQREAIAVTDEQQRKFSSGWKEAWQEYKDDANDNSKRAKELFTTYSSQMESAFVDFVMTGKANFRDLVKDMIKQLLKIVAKKIFIKIIDLLTGGLGSLFAGFFDKGGQIGAGQFGVVGEKGPEIVTGPATVIGRQETAELMQGGGGSVTYNINAVDARSFKQMVARDPEFIYNVSQAGARRLPS